MAHPDDASPARFGDGFFYVVTLSDHGHATEILLADRRPLQDLLAAFAAPHPAGMFGFSGVLTPPVAVAGRAAPEAILIGRGAVRANAVAAIRYQDEGDVAPASGAQGDDEDAKPPRAPEPSPGARATAPVTPIFPKKP